MAFGREPTFQSILESRQLEKRILEIKCSEKLLVAISQSITSWKQLSPFLGLTPQDEEDIQSDHMRNAERRVAILRRWSEKFGDEATYFKLGEAFEALKWRNCIAELLDLYQQEMLQNLESVAEANNVPGKQQLPTSPLGN